MEKKQFLELLDKYISGKALPEEEQRLFNFYNSFGRSSELDTQLDSGQLGDEMLNRVMEIVRENESRRKANQLTLWKRLTVAAVMLIATTAGFYFYSTEGVSETEQFTEINLKNDISPGSDKAVLSLADGSEINLNDAANGLLAHQGNMAITKTGTGKIIYKRNIEEHIDGVVYQPVINTIKTPKGGRYQVTLPDGSRVWLNSASALEFPAVFAKTERKVKLRGEAYFEITHDKKVPFLVENDNQIVEVLGTHFNINSYENYTRTTLMEGSVRVILRSSKSRTSQTQLLKPGEQSLTDSSGSVIRIEKTDVETANAWKEGHFKFKNTPIRDIMKEIARWYDVELVYDGKMPSDEFTGYISNELNISAVLKIMEQSCDVKFAIKGKTLKISSI